jgi:hypothetical protein
VKRVISAGMVVAVVGLAAPLVASGKPPKPPKAPGPGLSLGATPNPVVYGSSTTLSGRLTGKGHAGKSVALQADPYPYDGHYSTVATTATASNGDLSFRQAPRLNTRYRARQGATQSGVVTVLVRFRTSLHLSDSTPGAGRRVRFSGRGCPKHDGGRVGVQRLTAAGWRTVKRTRLRAATRCSVYRTRFRVHRGATYRTVVAGDASHARGISPRRRVDVH